MFFIYTQQYGEVELPDLESVSEWAREYLRDGSVPVKDHQDTIVATVEDDGHVIVELSVDDCRERAMTVFTDSAAMEGNEPAMRVALDMLERSANYQGRRGF